MSEEAHRRKRGVLINWLKRLICKHLLQFDRIVTHRYNYEHTDTAVKSAHGAAPVVCPPNNTQASRRSDAQTVPMTDLATELLKRHEGFSSRPYRCTSGKLTVGYGRNLDDRGVTPAEAEYLLRNDIAEAVAWLDDQPFWPNLNDARQAVLIDMYVNLGRARLLGFRKLFQALHLADYNQAAHEMLNSLWANQVGIRADILAGIMRTGEVVP